MSTIERLNALLEGRYRVDREIGAGGMAVVYGADDVKHGRRVAIKVLREELATSAAAARFLREIEIAARLQHPNILPLLDSGTGDGLTYFVMPFVEGPSLRERLAAGGLSVSDAVRIIAEMADALAYAHARGVVHRDIKPDNVMLTGRHALITDFGVARAVTAATDSKGYTSAGIALGTPLYMAPEQIAADPALDHRADIYALGLVAFELIAGRSPFAGISPQGILAAQISTPPPRLSTRRDGVPSVLDDAIMKCLAKDPAERWQSASEFLAQVESVPTTDPEGSEPRGTTARSTRSTRMRYAVVTGALAVVVVVVFIAMWRMTDHGAPSAFTIGTATQFTTDEGIEFQPDFSPDGKLVAYTAGSGYRLHVLIRPTAGGRAIPLTTDSLSAELQPRWSPDGQSILYLVNGDVRIALASGGSSRVGIAMSGADSIFTAAWSPDGSHIAYATADSLFIIDADGSKRRFVGASSELHSCTWSRRAFIACVSGNASSGTASVFGNIAPSAIVVFRASGDGGVRQASGPLQSNRCPVWSADGATLYFVSDRQGPSDIYAVGVSDRGSFSGEPQRITSGLGASTIALSADRTHLAYSVYAARANVWSAQMSGASLTSLAPVTAGNQVVEDIRVSHDDAWLVFDSNLRGRADIYRMRIGGGQPERLTNGVDESFRGDLSPDGREIAFQSFRTGSRDIYVQPVVGGDLVAVTNTPSQEAGPVWSPDGRALAFVDLAQHNMYVVRRAASGRWGTPRLRSVGGPGSADWSPDGQWVAVASGGTIHLAPPDSGTDRLLYAPHDGSTDPPAEQVVWSHDGSGIYFKSHDANGRASFWSIPPRGGPPKLVGRLDDATRTSSRPDFAVSGHRLYFVIQDRLSAIWIAEISTHR